MATNLETKTLNVQVLRRTWRIEIFTDLNLEGNYEMRVHRETVYVDTETGDVIKQIPDTQPISKKLGEFEAGDPVLGLANAISELADSWDVPVSNDVQSVDDSEELPGD
jgi:hypothetical protein